MSSERIEIYSDTDSLVNYTHANWERIGSRTFWTIEPLQMSSGTYNYLYFDIPSMIEDAPSWNAPPYFTNVFHQTVQYDMYSGGATVSVVLERSGRVIIHGSSIKNGCVPVRAN